MPPASLEAVSRPSPTSALYRRVCICLLFFVAASASFQGYYEKWHFRETGVPGGAGTLVEVRYGMAEILDGTAARPYVFRQLLPTLANWADRTAPQKIKDILYTHSGYGLPSTDFSSATSLARNPVYFFRYLAMYALVFLFAWLAVYAMYLVCKAFELPTPICVLAPVAMILAMPYIMSNGGYFYDYPELAFLALAFWMALKFDWWWMIPLVALATWNKESFLLAVLSLFPIFCKRNSRVGALIATAVLSLTSVAVYFPLRLRYAHNPGGTVFNNLASQLIYISRPYHYVQTEVTYGIAAFKAFSLIPLLLIVWTVWRGWPRLPKEVRRHAQIAAVISFPLFLVFCSPGELRDLSLLYIVFLLLIAVNMSPETDLRSKSAVTA